MAVDHGQLSLFTEFTAVIPHTIYMLGYLIKVRYKYKM